MCTQATFTEHGRTVVRSTRVFLLCAWAVDHVDRARRVHGNVVGEAATLLPSGGAERELKYNNKRVATGPWPSLFCTLVT